MTEPSIAMADRPCWGEVDLPLLPRQWRHRLSPIPIDLRRRNQRTGDPGPTAAVLATGIEWNRYWWEEPPTAFATNVLERILEFDPLPDFLDLPVVAGRFRVPEDVAHLPFLVSTWKVLDERVGGPEAVARSLGWTALELLAVTDSPSAVLDMAITSPSWIDLDGASGTLTVHHPSTPSSVDDVYPTAGLRHLRSAMVDPRYLDPESPWFEAICGRAGIHPSGHLTLEEAGALVGVTRERVRQVVKGCHFDHGVQRRWPLPEPLRLLRTTIRATDGLILTDANQVLARSHGWLGDGGFEKALQILGWYGQAPDLSVGHLGTIGPATDHLQLPEGLNLESIPQMIWDLSDKTGFTLEIDLRRELLRLYPSLDLRTLDEVLEAVLPPLRLPMGYLFHTTHSRPAVVGILDRMTAWTHDLSVETFHRGLSRRFRFRQFTPPPPTEVLASLVERLEDFEILDDRIVPALRRSIDTTTILGWVGEQLRESPSGVLHRSVILETARQEGLNTTSVAIYLQFGEIIQPIGQNCFTLVGTRPTPIDIENARRDASLLRIPERISTSYVDGGARLAVTVGSLLRDSGVMSVPARLRRMIGERRLQVISDLGDHGSSIVSGALLTGFSSVFNALDVMTGDDLTVRIDLSTLTMHVGPDEGPDPTGEPDED